MEPPAIGGAVLRQCGMSPIGP